MALCVRPQATAVVGAAPHDHADETCPAEHSTFDRATKLRTDEGRLRQMRHADDARPVGCLLVRCCVGVRHWCWH